MSALFSNPSSASTTFQIALPGPSVNSVQLYDRYAREIAARGTQMQGILGTFPFLNLHSVAARRKVVKYQRRWEVRIFRGITSGVTVSIVPLAGQPHIANVTVAWTSRFLKLLIWTFGIVFCIAAIPSIVVASQLSHSFLFAILVVGFFGLIACGVFVLLAVMAASRLVGSAGADQYKRDRVVAIADMIRQIPVPARASL
jgi:hypothetical protein